MKREGCPPGTYKIDHKCKKFYNSTYMSSRDKHLVYTEYRTFLDSLKKEYGKTKAVNGRIHSAPFFKFHERLYKHLHNHCGFIAHYDRGGFYATYFEDPDDTILFLARMRTADEEGGKDYNDINEALSEETKRYMPNLISSMNLRAKKRDIETAQALLKKHGLKIKGLK